MEKLNCLREEINEIDESLVNLFKKRMKIVSEVAEYKRKNSMDILDRSREEQIISKHVDEIEDEHLKDNLKQFLEELMCISRKAQKEMLSKSFNEDKV